MQSSSTTSTTESKATTSRLFPLLLILFAGSGCSALIYEVAWYQILQLALGSTAVSMGFLLAAFMGGLCIGSLALPKMNLRRVHPMRVYSMLEFGIAILGIVATLLMPLLSQVYFAGAEPGLTDMILRGVIAAVAMLPSTILMGASLPAIVRWIEATPRGVQRWALLYGGNTAGAVFGCLFAGFYLLRIYNMNTAAYAAAIINVAVALVSLWMSRHVPAEAAAETQTETPAEMAASDAELESGGGWPIYLSIAISGACALGAEVLFTRLMGMLLLGTVYVFSVILAVFLIGLAIGGAAAAPIMRRVRPALALAWSQILLTVAIVWAGVMICQILPFWNDDVLTTANPWTMYLLDFKRCIVAILPPTLLWGASFPLACAAALKSRKDDPGRIAGNVYAANTLGAIVGALAVSLILIPVIGTQDSTKLILVLSAIGGAVALIPLFHGAHSKSAMVGLAAAVALATVMVWQVPEVPGELIAYGRQMRVNHNQSTILYTAEGRNSSVAISRWNNGTIYVNVNGHVEATTEPFDMKLQRMVGHLPGLIHPNPQSVLGIGFGAGVSAGTFTRYPTVKKITVCEIEPVIPPASTRFFATADYDVYHNPKTHIVYDDARHFLMTTKEKFDIIASDPLDVFVKGTAALYSKEYFEAVKAHLNPGGMFSLYVPLYESDEKTVKSELATFFDAFPNGSVWQNTREGQGYDMVFMGQADPLHVNLDEAQQRLMRPDYAPVAESLHDIGIDSAYDLFSTYSGGKGDLGRWTAGAEINRDSNLRLSYLAGWSINSSLENTMYQEMLAFRQSPENVFTGSSDSLKNLGIAMQKQ